MVLAQCRVCDKFKENEDHLVSGCPMMTANEFLHDRGENIFTGNMSAL